jgi:hypothetical protein
MSPDWMVTSGFDGLLASLLVGSPSNMTSLLQQAALLRNLNYNANAAITTSTILDLASVSSSSALMLNSIMSTSRQGLLRVALNSRVVSIDTTGGLITGIGCKIRLANDQYLYSGKF